MVNQNFDENSDSNSNFPYRGSFQSALEYKFYFSRQYDLRELANFINRKYDTTYRYIVGRTAIPPKIIRSIIRFVFEKNSNDIELGMYFCPPGWILTKEVDQKVTKEKRDDKQISMSILNGDVFRAIKETYKDKKVEPKEYKKVHELLIMIRQAALELDEIVKKDMKGGDKNG